MNEDQLNTLRQQDINLRDAIRMDEMERPQMPADLNARAAVIAVYLTPPKDTTSPLTPLQEARGTTEAENVVEAPVNNAEQPAAQPVQVPVKRIVAKVEPKKVETPSVVPQEQPATTEQLLAQETKPVEQKVEQKSVTLTERDIPITRPENYKYTPEEIALMKKQANEAYLKWVELEMEIAKNNLEQTAQNQ